MNLDNFVRYLEVNDAFHVELWRLAKSPMLVRTIESLITLPFAAPSACSCSPTPRSTARAR